MATTDWVFPLVVTPEADGWLYTAALQVATIQHAVYGGTAQKAVHTSNYYENGLHLWSVDDVDGIEIRPPGGGGCALIANRELEFWLTLDGVQQGSAKTIEMPQPDGTPTAGGAGDLWGSSLTKSQIMSPSFGVSFKKKSTGVGEIRVQWIQLRLHYSSLL